MFPPSTPLTLFLKTAAPGRRFITLEHFDRHIHSYAHRVGARVRCERASLVIGTHAAPQVESAVIVTLLGRIEHEDLPQPTTKRKKDEQSSPDCGSA